MAFWVTGKEFSFGFCKFIIWSLRLSSFTNTSQIRRLHAVPQWLYVFLTTPEVMTSEKCSKKNFSLHLLRTYPPMWIMNDCSLAFLSHTLLVLSLSLILGSETILLISNFISCRFLIFVLYCNPARFGKHLFQENDISYITYELNINFLRSWGLC